MGLFANGYNPVKHQRRVSRISVVVKVFNESADNGDMFKWRTKTHVRYNCGCPEMRQVLCHRVQSVMSDEIEVFEKASRVRLMCPVCGLDMLIVHDSPLHLEVRAECRNCGVSTPPRHSVTELRQMHNEWVVHVCRVMDQVHKWGQGQ